ncbi:MAG: FecR domain-containing protein [Deltaproteobacteria bacterium]|nr:FecR domain-containing protein [Deltaproteobacteria bacterium]MBN2672983.1 FecR domain-containing protein [Deltaproteobacteria bacterium]
MNRNTPPNWTALSEKMVCSYSNDELRRLQHGVLEKYNRRCQRIRVLIPMAILLLFALSAGVIQFAQKVEDVSQPEQTEIKLNGPVNVISPEQSALAGIEQSIRDKGKVNETPTVVPLTPGTQFFVEEELESSTYRIVQGGLRFATDSLSRKLIVRVGSLRIEDIGTVFTTEILPEEQVRVSVQEGKVIVTWPSGTAELKEGADGTFPTGEQIVSSEARKNVSPTTWGRNSRQTDWRDAAKQGENSKALTLIDANPACVHNEVDDLLLAADVMRLTGHPKRAVLYLNRVIRNFSSDSRRSVAAFTLGKVLVDEIGNPSAAAQAFHIAAENRSPIAEEALAREIDAYHSAGNSIEMNKSARLYLVKYPNGTRAVSVRALLNEN